MMSPRVTVFAMCGLLSACDRPDADASRGVAEYEQADGGVLPDGGFGEIEPLYGLHGRQRVEAYDFGPVKVDAQGRPAVSPMYVFYDEAGSPLLELSADGDGLEGQGALVETLVDRSDYSPFWEIIRVVVPAGYDVDSIKSLETLRSRGYSTEPTGAVVNCPIVEHSATLTRGLAERERPLPRMPLWFRRLEASCFLVDRGWEVLQDPEGGLGLPLDIVSMDVVEPVLELYGEHVVAKDNRLFSAVPGQPEYSPLVRLLETPIDHEFAFGDLDEISDVEESAPREPLELRNMPVRGIVASCGTNEDCAETATGSDSSLTCNLDLRIPDPIEPTRPAFCDAPPVGFGQECGPGVARCDPFGGPVPPESSTGQLQDLICVGLRSREKRFCYNACDPDEDDATVDEHRDSRCGNVRDFQCYGLRRTKKPDGVCFRRCNSLATNRLVAQCANAMADTEPAPSPDDVRCGNGAFDIGEACDPTAEPWDGTTCNETCSVSSLREEPPVQVGDDRHPLECTNAGIDICIFPDERADEETP